MRLDNTEEARMPTDSAIDRESIRDKVELVADSLNDGSDPLSHHELGLGWSALARSDELFKGLTVDKRPNQWTSEDFLVHWQTLMEVSLAAGERGIFLTRCQLAAIYQDHIEDDPAVPIALRTDRVLSKWVRYEVNLREHLGGAPLLEVAISPDTIAIIAGTYNTAYYSVLFCVRTDANEWDVSTKGAGLALRDAVAALDELIRHGTSAWDAHLQNDTWTQEYLDKVRSEAEGGSDVLLEVPIWDYALVVLVQMEDTGAYKAISYRGPRGWSYKDEGVAEGLADALRLSNDAMVLVNQEIAMRADDLMVAESVTTLSGPRIISAMED